MNPTDDLADILQGQDQILMAAWTLPNEGTLSDAHRRQAMMNFKTYIEKNGITKREVAKKLGSPRETTIHELTIGKYRSHADDHIRTLNMWVEQHARTKAAQVNDDYVETRTARAILTTARLVHENKTMGMVIGPTGIGKTRCAEALAQTYVGSIYMRIINGLHHPRGLAHAIAAPIGVLDHRSMTHMMHHSLLERIIERLRESDRMVIIDEAHKLTDDALEMVRDVHDCAGVPILMFATTDLHDRIMRSVGPDHGQMYSRFDVVHHLTQGKDIYSGGKPLFSIDEIRKLYERTPIRLAPDAAKYLQDVANQVGHGSLRRCKTLLRNAVRRARKRLEISEGCRITVSAIDFEWVEARLRMESSEQHSVQERQTARRATAE